MVRTQVLLPEDIYEAAKLAAFQKRISLSEIVRQGLYCVIDIKKNEEKPVKTDGRDILLGLVKNMEKVSKKVQTKAPSDLSSRTDYYLYGKGRKE